MNTFGFLLLSCLLVAAHLLVDAEPKGNKKKGKHPKPDPQTVTYEIRGGVVCDDATASDKFATVAARPYFGNFVEHVTHVAKSFFSANNGKKKRKINKAVVPYGESHNVLLTGRTKAKAIAVEVNNKNPHSIHCAGEFTKVYSLEDATNGHVVIDLETRHLPIHPQTASGGSGSGEGQSGQPTGGQFHIKPHVDNQRQRPRHPHGGAQSVDETGPLIAL